MTVSAFAFDTVYLGYRNQLIGALKVLSGDESAAFSAENYLLHGEKDDIENLCFSHCENYDDFREKIFAVLQKCLPQLPDIPKVFITAYNLTETGRPDENADMVCRAVKEYWQKSGLGNILTTVLSGRLHDYKYVDLINVPQHFLNDKAKKMLENDERLRRKALVTLGTIHSFTKENVQKKNDEFVLLMKKKFASAAAERQAEKLRNFMNTPKKVVICLGGRAEKGEIVFTRRYAEKLWEKCGILTDCGYGTVIVNGPRTPNFVTDYLYEKSKENSYIVFQNCKTVAETAEEREKWRLYSGKYEQEFLQLKEIGNIYPAVLGFDNTLAVHTVDSFSCCETISAGIPTAVSTEDIYINFSREDCFRLFNHLTPEYAVVFEDFVNQAQKGTEPKNLRIKNLPDVLKVFAEAVQKLI